MKLGKMLFLGLILILNPLGLAAADDVSETSLPELTIYGGNRIPTNRELTNIRINTVKLKVEDNDWKTVLQEQVQIIAFHARGQFKPGRISGRRRKNVLEHNGFAEFCCYGAGPPVIR
jgi:hypothetical protein